MFTFMQAVSSKFYILPEYLHPSVTEKCTVLIFMRAWFSDMATSLANKVIQFQMWCRKARIGESICSKMCLSWEKRVHFNDNYTVAQFCLSAAEVRPYGLWIIHVCNILNQCVDHAEMPLSVYKNSGHNFEFLRYIYAYSQICAFIALSDL